MKLPRFEEEGHLAKKLQSLLALEEYEKTLVGGMIRKLRIRSNLTQKALASRIHTSQSVIARIETGKQNMSLKVLVAITHALKRKLHIKIV